MTMRNQPILPTIMVIFGATGDLIAKKIVPALWHLSEHHYLPQLLRIIGFSRRPLSHEAFRTTVRTILECHHDGSAPDPQRLTKFLDHFFYHQGQFPNLEDYQSLARALGQTDGAWNVCSNKLFYLAVPPQWYETIARNLHASGLTTPCGPEEGWTRVLVEKPFGYDQQTAKQLDGLLGSLFREIQIYRIDHYLAKEMAQNILTFRFSNNLFAKHWSSEEIERIDIRLFETIGVEDRGAFYDHLGALRDVGQNHLLQLLALVTMDHPGDLRASAIRLERAKILECLKPMSNEDITQGTRRGQYRGYRSIAGVDPESTTETSFSIRAVLDHDRWRNTTIALEGGKKMGSPRKEVVITFRHPSPCLCPPLQGIHAKNTIIFSVEPSERVELNCWLKRPGLEFELMERSLSVQLRDHRSLAQYVEEYEKLLMDAIMGDQTLFVSTAEVNAMWRFIDPIVSAWKENVVPLEFYESESSI